MTHTLEAIADNGIEIIVQPFQAQEVESITLYVEGDNYRAENEKMLVEWEVKIRMGALPEKYIQRLLETL